MEKLLDLIADQPLALVTLGIVLALIIGFRYLGLWQGQHTAPAASSGSAQVAAVIVDPTALLSAAGSVDGLTVAVTEANVTARAHATATDKLASQIDGLANVVDDLKNEVIRATARLK
ncbi:hypothetical protein [Devosia sp. 2618]|uniref:hypothetical protein n=1 Tax=Devosia sp. 2618 TaxID=3156454 RepID=UPI0033908A20